MSVWKSDETLLSICILNFSFKNDFVWEEISNIRHSVSSPDKTPQSSSKILRCASYFQLSSRCFIWWSNTASHVWYITSRTGQTCRGFQKYIFSVLFIFLLLNQATAQAITDYILQKLLQCLLGMNPGGGHFLSSFIPYVGHLAA